MKKPVLKLSVIVLAIIVIACTKPDQGSPVDQPSKKTAGKKIPFNKIYSTSPQNGMKYASRTFNVAPNGPPKFTEPYGNTLQQIYSGFRGGGPICFLAQGETISEAIGATWKALLDRGSLERPLNSDRNSKSGQFWLVAYLGVKCSGAFIVDSVEEIEKGVRLTYKGADSDAADICQYFYWVPLPKGIAGNYTLELVDSVSQVVIVKRVVIIPKK